jgi:hypothetical protein
MHRMFNACLPTVVLLVSFEHNTESFLSQLLKDSISGKINLVIRYINTSSVKSPISLSGYGVELALKNTEYVGIVETDNANGTRKLTAAETSSTLFILLVTSRAKSGFRVGADRILRSFQ